MGGNDKFNTIFFDAGGVLFDTKISRSQRIKNILEAKGFDDGIIEKAIFKGD
jgi:putative hydrolase of the HAD superfamily